MIAHGADEIDEYVKYWLSRYQLPGMALVAARNNDLVFEHYWGRANFEDDTPVNANTVFEINSIAKQFCSVAILLLVRKGKIGVTDKISLFFDDKHQRWGEIDIENLLTHTSGIKNYFALPEESWPTVDTVPEYIREVNGSSLEFLPGEGWAYSNTGYMMLASIVEQVSGLAYEAFVQERIFQPLGMSVTKANDPQDIFTGGAIGYVSENGGWKKQTGSLNQGPPGPGGTLSSISDLLQWGNALGGGYLLNKPALEEMWQPILLNDGQTAKTIFLDSLYGFGWCISELNGVKTCWTPGTGMGFTSIFVYLPDRPMTVIGLSNGSRMPDFNWFNRFVLEFVELTTGKT